MGNEVVYIAQRPFKADGVDWKPGDVVPAEGWATKLALQHQGYIAVVRRELVTLPPTAEKPPATEPVDPEEAIKLYHKGFGRYEIPGIGLVQGKEAAIAAWKRQNGNG